MKSKTLLNRRAFVQRASYVSAASGISTLLPWLPAIAEPSIASSPRFAYVGSSGITKGIHVFAIEANRWVPIHTIATSTPSGLALHPSQNFLYATHAVDIYRGLPTGAIEAYSIDPHSGRLTSINQQPLSLSATMPNDLAVSPDGRHLAVAAFGGGAYNLLPIREDGSLDHVSSIRKEIGSGPHQQHQTASHPHSLAFDAAGHLISTDLGADRLNIFIIADGKLIHSSSIPQAPGSGPGNLAFHPPSNLLFVANEFDASISTFRINILTGETDRSHHRISALPANFHGQRSVTTLLLHPSGKFLYTANQRRESSHPMADSLVTWKVHPDTGTISPIQHITANLHRPHAALVTSDSTSLFVLNRESGVLQFPIDSNRGILGRPLQTTNIHMPRSMALRYI